MTNSPHANYYADNLTQERVSLVSIREVGKATYNLRFSSPTLAKKLTPGQFLMVRLADLNDPLIGRALAIYNILPSQDGNPHDLEVVFLVEGKFTSLAQTLRPGDQLEVWGPLGNGFPPRKTDHLVMVAGGVGITPFLLLGKEYLGLQSFGRPDARADRVTLCYGARSAEYLSCLDDYAAAEIPTKLSTDDGSRGHHGPVTDLVASVISEAKTKGETIEVVCCGPEPMMKAVAKLTAKEEVSCQVSLETPMACGIGICFSCVAEVYQEDGQPDYKRTCVEGPVFDAEKISW
ncbi:MAG: dihydroorotate dehydrogenase electron transfer subunit [Pirellulaceae bacterium]|nr:dihydroorotate dehydrogenase electron transfer subunit [Pirellulaceae bacterium]